MFGPSPLPLAFLALWSTVPGIWLGAAALTEKLAADRGIRGIIRPAVALAAWVVAVQIASMAFRSFWIGLPVGMCVLSVAGLALWWKDRGSSPDGAAATDTERGFPRAMWLSMALATAPIALMSLLGHFHDDILPNQHMSIVAQLQNDYFPPSFLGFTQFPLRYHYGFDLVCAGLTALAGARVDLGNPIAYDFRLGLLLVLGMGAGRAVDRHGAAFANVVGRDAWRRPRGRHGAGGASSICQGRLAVALLARDIFGRRSAAATDHRLGVFF